MDRYKLLKNYSMSERSEQYPLSWGKRKKNVVCVCVYDCDSDQTLVSIVTKCYTHILGRKISFEFGNGQNRLKRFKMRAILNT